MSKKSRFSKKELKEFESLIAKRKAKVSQELKSLSGLLEDQTAHISSRSQELNHDSSQIRNHEMLKRMKTRAEGKVTKYKKALQRIKKGTYGICRKTGKPISKERLMTLPEATLCINSKRK